MLLALFSMIGFTVLGIVIYTQKENETYKKWRKIIAFVDSFIWILLMVMFIQYISIGMILLILLSVGHTIGLLKINKLDI